MILPNAAYIDPGYLERERGSVRRSTWQFAARVSELSRAGNAVPVTVANSPVLLLRDESGVIKAFDNVCPHRGTRLLYHGNDS